MKDTNCGIKLVLITDSTIQLISNLPSKVNNKTKRVIFVIALVSGVWFSNVQPPTAIVRVQRSYQHDSKVKTAPTVSRR